MQAIHDALPPRPRRCPVKLCCQVVKELSIVRGRLSALLLIAQSSAHSAAPPLGAGIQSGRRGQSVLFNQMHSLRGPRNDAAVSAEGALSTRALCKLVAAARNPRLGAKPGSAVVVRQRRNMNCYFHSSTVSRMRRKTETLRIFLQLGRPWLAHSKVSVLSGHEFPSGGTPNFMFDKSNTVVDSKLVLDSMVAFDSPRSEADQV